MDFLLKELELKYESSLDYFCSRENEAQQMISKNIELFEEFCVESFVKLKNDINTNGILIDDNIFRVFYNKLNEISQYKNEYFNQNLSKYEDMNLLFSPFTKEIEKLTENIKSILEDSLNKDIFKNFHDDIDKNVIEKINKEIVDDLIFRNVKVERKSLKKTFVKVKSNIINRISYEKIKMMSEPKRKRNNNINKNYHNIYSNTKRNLSKKVNGVFSKIKKVHEFNDKGEKDLLSKDNIKLSFFSQNNNENKMQENECVQKKSEDADLNETILFMYPVLNSNTLYAIDEEESTIQLKVHFNKFCDNTYILLDRFPKNGAFCNFNNYLYFTGGQEIEKKSWNIFLEISLKENSTFVNIEKMPFTINPHWNHSMVGYKKKIFVIGGFNSNKCEAFNFETNKWEMLPDLNSKERQRPVICVFNDYLYTFMGYTEENFINYVERIDIKNLNRWEIIKTFNPNSINLNFYGAGVYCSNEKIYFVGGKTGKGHNDEDYKYEIYSYSVDKITFENTNVFLPGKLNFIENKLFKCGGESVGHMIEENENDAVLFTIELYYLSDK